MAIALKLSNANQKKELCLRGLKKDSILKCSVDEKRSLGWNSGIVAVADDLMPLLIHTMSLRWRDSPRAHG